ncbi:hypothetical protein SAMN05192568_103651 [Methylobacterium pseudosasicola]|uniref:Uncharacterized protein n=1 Tax=Methylobacterium pseudosasicola TaxID=582667 RepID=A0A1I4RLU1_9HYPH|nr:hypothetical protein SAMN05192568_103651 [Methylobacterium pseudosasicola]
MIFFGSSLGYDAWKSWLHGFFNGVYDRTHAYPIAGVPIFPNYNEFVV